jgi:hypothetical protein
MNVFNVIKQDIDYLIKIARSTSSFTAISVSVLLTSFSEHFVTYCLLGMCK